MTHYASGSMVRPSRLAKANRSGLSRRRFGLGVVAGTVGALWLGRNLMSNSESVKPEPDDGPRAAGEGGALPALFVAHGAPTLALDPDKGSDFRRWGAALPKPSGIVVVSAHWEAAPVTIGSVEQRELVYDFYGFPKPLYEVRYPAPGAPELARRVEALAASLGSVRRDTTRGLDHGVWVPLLHLFPGADVPVLQISMPSSLGAKALFALGERLAPLRQERVLIVGSGNLTHNLRRLDWRGEGGPPVWAGEFDAWVADVLARRDFDALVDYAKRAPALREAHPTEEHLQPLLVAAGAASTGSGPVTFPVSGFEYGSLSRRSVQLG